MPDTKICTQCHEEKLPDAFYRSKGTSRSECKECTKAKNTAYQKLNKVWRYRYSDDESRRDYLREYYQNNKEKFAQYRKQFIDSHPGYHRNYYLNNKGK